ncbi:MAG: monovalent cation/H(+) antiporter subunit G [Rhodobacteraceae bacterium]|nr:monovalent cation/H(+) antiporter subunit G [Paracoccaceae bacterium]
MSILVTLQEVLSWILILAGAFFVLVGAIGTVRFPDFWARLHAASVSDSAGMILLFLGMALQAGFSLVAVKLAIIGAFLFLTGPTSTHATANAALVSGLRPKEAEGLTGAELRNKDTAQAIEPDGAKDPGA